MNNIKRLVLTAVLMLPSFSTSVDAVTLTDEGLKVNLLREVNMSNVLECNLRQAMTLVAYSEDLRSHYVNNYADNPVMQWYNPEYSRTTWEQIPTLIAETLFNKRHKDINYYRASSCTLECLGNFDDPKDWIVPNWNYFLMTNVINIALKSRKDINDRIIDHTIKVIAEDVQERRTKYNYLEYSDMFYKAKDDIRTYWEELHLSDYINNIKDKIRFVYSPTLFLDKLYPDVDKEVIRIKNSIRYMHPETCTVKSKYISSIDTIHAEHKYQISLMREGRFYSKKFTIMGLEPEMRKISDDECRYRNSRLIAMRKKVQKAYNAFFAGDILNTSYLQKLYKIADFIQNESEQLQKENKRKSYWLYGIFSSYLFCYKEPIIDAYVKMMKLLGLSTIENIIGNNVAVVHDIIDDDEKSIQALVTKK